MLGVGLLWLAGQLAALLAGHGWPSTWAAAPRFAGLLVHGRMPSTAWVTAMPPGAVPWPDWLYFLVLGLLLVALAWVGFLAVRRLLPRLADARAPKGALWGTAATERKIAVPDEPARRAWRLTAGRGTRTGKLLAAEDCVSAVAFGTNGSGKSTGLVVPNVLEWPGSVVMTTTKPQDVAMVLARRQALGPVWVLSPGAEGPYEPAGWSPVDYAVDEESADRMAEWLCEASGMGVDPKSRAWISQARKYIKPLLLAARVGGGGIEAFTRWLYEGEDAATEVRAVLAEAGFPAARREYSSTWSIHDEGKGSVLFTAYGLADAYSRPGMRASAARSDFAPADLVGDRPATLIIVAPESDAERFAPLFTALIAAISHAAEQKAGRTGGPIELRLLLALDEAGNVFRYPKLPSLLSTARGNGIQLLLVYHDLAQLEHLYGGRAVARTVVSNAKLRMLLPGVGDLETLRYFSDLLGRAVVSRTSRTRGGPSRTTSVSDSSEDLAPLHVLQQLPDGEAVMQYQNLPPMRVRLRFCFRDRALRRLGADAPERVA